MTYFKKGEKLCKVRMRSSPEKFQQLFDEKSRECEK